MAMPITVPRYTVDDLASFPNDGNRHELVDGVLAWARAERVAPGTCRPGLSVPNLDEFHQRMVAHGVTCLQEPKAVFGSRVAMYLDPDALAISVGEDREGSTAR